MSISKIIFPVVATLLFGLYWWWRKRTLTIEEFRKKYKAKYGENRYHEALKFKPDKVLVRIKGDYRVFWVSQRGKWHHEAIEYCKALVF